MTTTATRSEANKEIGYFESFETRFNEFVQYGSICEWTVSLKIDSKNDNCLVKIGKVAFGTLLSIVPAFVKLLLAGVSTVWDKAKSVCCCNCSSKTEKTPDDQKVADGKGKETDVVQDS